MVVLALIEAVVVTVDVLEIVAVLDADEDSVECLLVVFVVD